MAALPFAIASAQQSPPAPAATPPPPFQVWLSNLIREAVSRGFDDGLVTRALGGLQPLPRVIQADRAQAGPSPGLEAYLSQRLTPGLIDQGRTQMREHRALLGRIERWFGVQRRFIVAIWGAETGYGPYSGDVPVFQALATLAWEPRRSDYFRSELFDALRMVQRGHIDIDAMRGSWAGAMGQPQFMPSSYLQYAYDFDRDGRRDIWRSTGDTLASIANYLRGFGWSNGETWGREVDMTAAVRSRIMTTVAAREAGCSAARALTVPRALGDWAAQGVRLASGRPLPRSNIEASLLLTADTRMFLVYRNYESILAYNCSHYYALSVAMLADAIR
jgi:membrane-bound lytic murein transglycosylase B